jgi:SAM-dependent methyltransferase
MKRYENGWIRMDDKAAKKAMGSKEPDHWLIDKIRDMNAKTVMDFGCGLGKNSFVMADLGMRVTMYDFPNIISIMKKSPSYKRLSDILIAEDRWMNVCMRQYDVILANFVFQHMPVAVADEYLDCMKQMTGRLLVHGRSHMDFEGGFTIDSLEKHFEIDDDYTPFSVIEDIKNKEDNKHFWAWMRPKGE